MAITPLNRAAPHLNYGDYLTLPDDGRRYEILEGELHVSPAPTPYHQMVCMRIEQALLRWAEEQGGGGRVLHAPVDVILADDSIA